MISKDNTINIVGTFLLTTYDNPLNLGEMTLKLSTNTDPNKRTWTYTEDHSQWFGWAHQRSIISLTLNAAYDPDSGITALSMDSSISAHTQGSVHPCSTYSEVYSAEFINIPEN